MVLIPSQTLNEVLILLELVLVCLTCFPNNVGVKKRKWLSLQFLNFYTYISRSQAKRDFIVSEKTTDY